MGIFPYGYIARNPSHYERDCRDVPDGEYPNAIKLALCTLGIFPYGYIADEPHSNESPARDVPDGEYPQCAQLPRTLN